MSWIRLEPENEVDGTRYAWRLVLEFDNDWQDWTVESIGAGGVRFSVHVADDMVEGLPLERVSSP